MMNTVEYITESRHMTSKIYHELLFSFKQRRFIIPYRHDSGKLRYRLLPGNYLKFSLFALKSQDYAKFSLVQIFIAPNGEVEEKEVYSIEMSYYEFLSIRDDINAPHALAMFITMIPAYHSTAYVEESDQMAEDTMTMVESIMKYLERKVISE